MQSFSSSRYIDHARVSSGPVIYDYHEEHSTNSCLFCQNVYHSFKSLITNWNKVCVFIFILRLFWCTLTNHLLPQSISTKKTKQKYFQKVLIIAIKLCVTVSSRLVQWFMPRWMAQHKPSFTLSFFYRTSNLCNRQFFESTQGFINYGTLNSLYSPFGFHVNYEKMNLLKRKEWMKWTSVHLYYGCHHFCSCQRIGLPQTAVPDTFTELVVLRVTQIKSFFTTQFAEQFALRTGFAGAYRSTFPFSKGSMYRLNWAKPESDSRSLFVVVRQPT